MTPRQCAQAASNPTSAAIKHIFNFDSGEKTRLPVKDDRTVKVYNAYKTVMEKAPRFCHGFNSCAIESQHNKRTKYASKRLSLPTSFANRSRTAVLGQIERPDFKLAVCDVLGIHLDDERRVAIQRYKEAQLAALAKKRSADVVLHQHSQLRQEASACNECEPIGARGVGAAQCSFGCSAAGAISDHSAGAARRYQRARR